MLDHIEKVALRKGLSKATVAQIEDDECVKRFFRKNGYKLKRDADVPDEFKGEKGIVTFYVITNRPKSRAES